jgi:hypothetical protein
MRFPVVTALGRMIEPLVSVTADCTYVGVEVLVLPPPPVVGVSMVAISVSPA